MVYSKKYIYPTVAYKKLHCSHFLSMAMYFFLVFSFVINNHVNHCFYQLEMHSTIKIIIKSNQINHKCD
jgi:hypothetical protein